MFTTIVAVIGGLNTVLRTVATWIIQLVTYIKQETTPQNIHVSRVIIV